jgi:predicted nucleic acid-binding Zn ribbon protein
MSDLPAAFLECRQCHAVVDFSRPMADDAHILCGKCGYDLGRYKDVKDAAERAIQGASILGSIKNPIKH